MTVFDLVARGWLILSLLAFGLLTYLHLLGEYRDWRRERRAAKHRVEDSHVRILEPIDLPVPPGYAMIYTEKELEGFTRLGNSHLSEVARQLLMAIRDVKELHTSFDGSPENPGMLGLFCSLCPGAAEGEFEPWPCRTYDAVVPLEKP